MGTYNIVVDHMKLDYAGIFDPNAMFKKITHWFNEHGIQRTEPKSFEYVLPDGKSIEWECGYWRRMTDYSRNIYKLRILMSGINDIQVMYEKKKLKLKKGKVLIYFDGYINWDDRNRWEGSAMLQFIRTMFHKYAYKGYTEKLEQQMTFDMHDLYNSLEKFFNMYTHYEPVTKIPSFYR